MIAQNMLRADSKINKIVIVASSWSFILFTYIDDARSNTNKKYLTFNGPCIVIYLVIRTKKVHLVGPYYANENKYLRIASRTRVFVQVMDSRIPRNRRKVSQRRIIIHCWRQTLYQGRCYYSHCFNQEF
jgi:hypothetical protein